MKTLTVVLLHLTVFASPTAGWSLFGENDLEGLPESATIYDGHEIEDGPEYGTDLSFPMHHSKVTDNYAWLPHNVEPENNPTPDRYKDMPVQILGDRQTPYDELVEGCRNHYTYSRGMCDSTERDRIAMNLRQPKSMQNYTELGFKKIKAPDRIFDVIKSFWDENKDSKKIENWGKGNTYTNHWRSPTYMVSVEDKSLRGGGYRLKQKIWDYAKSTLQEWTGEELAPSSLYGIRMYTEGSVLASHVDRMPLVCSAIINVDQDIDEPWPLEVIGHDGKAHNVTMHPGDMVLYESHSIIHGRPFPLKGRFYSNIFIHFEPVGHTLRHTKTSPGKKGDQYQEAVNNGHAGHENDNSGLPTYVQEGSEEAKRYNGAHGGPWKPAEVQTGTTGSTDAHSAAGEGDLPALDEIARKEKHKLTKKDQNGWEPIHEGARGGHTNVLELLIKNGANINERTNHGAGGSPLYLAVQAHGKKHASVKFLEKMGAQYIEPEL